MRIVLSLLLGLCGIASLSRGIRALGGSYKRWILFPYWHYPPTKRAILAAYRTGRFRGDRLSNPTWGIATALILVTGGAMCVEVCLLMMLLPYLSPGQANWGLGIAAILLVVMLMSPVGCRWFRFHWAYWLEENYGDKLDVLLADIRRDPKAWERRVATREGLEKWAREVAGKPWPAGRTNGTTQATKQRRTIIRSDEYKRKRAQETVRSVVESFSLGEQFTILDLERACQGINRGMILQVLVQLHAQGLVECKGRGSSALWWRV